ncbi:MAG: class I SAM-dependent methyltransferase [Candidatus Paceibacterota bacterium]
MINEQGANSIDVFHGRSQSYVIQAFYKDSVPLYAGLIRKNLKPGRYSVADFGGHKGELLSEFISALPEYQFEPIILDKVEGLETSLNFKKIVGDIIGNSLPNKSVDIVIMRYVLPWDAYENQKLILNEVKRVCKNLAIIQHQGAPSDNPKPLQEATKVLWGGTIPTLKRDHGFFTESSQVEKWMVELGMNFEKVEEKYIETLSEMFIEKFKLNESEADQTKKILNGCDGITITTWVVRG